jgi:hypothetical protein
MIRFSYSNEDIKNKKKKENLTIVWIYKLYTALNIKRAIGKRWIHTFSWCFLSVLHSSVTYEGS